MKASLKFRMEQKLKKDFAETATQQGHTAAAMLRGFMRAYTVAAAKMEGKPFNIKLQAEEVVK